MTNGGSRRRWRFTRETRLLLLTIAISVGALFVLGRFRFPAEELAPPVVGPPAPPLERLAARATYDELAAIVARLETRIRPSIVVLQVSDPQHVQATSVRDLLSTRPVMSARTVPALRVAADMAVAIVPPDVVVEAMADSGGEATLIAYDPLRQVALVRVPALPEGEAWRAREGDRPLSPTYLVVVDAVQHRLALRPLLSAGQTDLVDSRWDRPLTSIGSSPGLSTGALVFGLDGLFIGVVVRHEEANATIAPASALNAAAERLLAGQTSDPGDLGIEVQELTPVLRRATGAAGGLIITHVDAAGPAAGLLEAGDVIETLDDRPVDSALTFLSDVAGTAPGTTVTVTRWRDGEAEPVAIAAGAYSELRKEPVPDERLGLTMRGIATVGVEVVEVEPGSVAAQTGFRAGDLIVRIGAVAAPSSAQILQIYRGGSGDDTTLVVVRRDGRHIMLAVPGAVPAHEPARNP